MKININWLHPFLELPEKKAGKIVVRERRTIKGIALINNEYYVLDYVPLSGFVWYSAMPINEEQVKEFSKNKNIDFPETSFSLFFDGESKTFCSFEQLPKNIQLNIQALTI